MQFASDFWACWSSGLGTLRASDAVVILVLLHQYTVQPMITPSRILSFSSLLGEGVDCEPCMLGCALRLEQSRIKSTSEV